MYIVSIDDIHYILDLQSLYGLTIGIECFMNADFSLISIIFDHIVHRFS